MKNIHIFPTDKPSILHFDDKLFLSKTYQLSKGINSVVEGRNIYITSDEEFKDEDYYLNIAFDTVHTKGSEIDSQYCKKIILTTDQQLIKDGVQAIDDEFLEWFVKSPSCEEVEVKTIDDSGWNYAYKIIIPKQRLEKYSERFDNDKSAIGNPDTWGKRIIEEPKQETLEEAIKIELENYFFSNISEIKQAEYFINFGAKWQQERMYSEEEVLDLLCARNIEFNLYEGRDKVEEWFEQFKKK